MAKIAPKVPTVILNEATISGTYKKIRKVCPKLDKKVSNHPKLTFLKLFLKIYNNQSIEQPL
jgi:hypothetical protein